MVRGPGPGMTIPSMKRRTSSMSSAPMPIFSSFRPALAISAPRMVEASVIIASVTGTARPGDISAAEA